jgi:phosphohistidine phosphatase
MRRLLLFRHAKAERPEPGARDHDRKLAERGREQAALIGAFMAHHRLVPDHVIVSTSRRTRETWELAATTVGASPTVAFDERIYDASTDRILTVIMETPQAVEGLLVVGHNPGLHDLARLLIASGEPELRERLNEKLPTAGLVVMDFAVEGWDKVHKRSGRLEVYVTPRTLAEAID